jgi:hypothetical protein
VSKRTAARLAWSILALALVLDLAGRFLDAQNGHADSAPILGDLGGMLALAAGALIVSRRPSNPIAWLLVISPLLLGFGGDGNLAYQYAIFVTATRPGALPAGNWVLWIGIIAQIIGFYPLVSFLLLLFPNGQLLSPRWRPVAWAAGIYLVISALLQAFSPLPMQAGELQIPNPLGIEGLGSLARWGGASLPILLGVALLGILSLFLRFRRAHGDERQQLKWFFFGALMIPLAVLLGVLGTMMSLTWVLDLGLWQLSVAGIPIAIGIALLKYRLYDIDLIIRRTLIYTVLTILLVLVYLGSVALLGQAFAALSGQRESEIVIVVSTLGIAALFAPLHRRVQDIIDRRFYRRKYDAQQVLARFGAAARDETDLGGLTNELAGVVYETVQLESLSLWLRPSSSPLVRKKREGEV